MTRRTIIIGGIALALAFAGGCGSSAPRTTQVVRDATPAAPTGPFFLAEFDNGVGAVSESSPTAVWREPNAVAALDGTSVFSIRPDGPNVGDRLVRLDPQTGAVMLSWALPTPGLSIAAVAPKARWIALTDRQPGYGNQGRTSTEIVVFDTRDNVELHHLTLTGDVQPEAFSIDGGRLFALNYLGDHYRVQTIDLDTGSRDDTSDRDKALPPEDMHGHAVHGVMSTDRTLLATLYRNPGDADEPAFVHVIDLEHGWSYCADLPAPFGTGPVGTDAIELTANDTVVVAARSADRLAEIHVDAVHTRGGTPVPVTYRAGTIAPPSATLQSMPGFEYVIGPVPQ